VAEIIRHPFFLLADDMGGMKTAQTIIAAQFLSEMEIINRVIVVCPASVRPVWYDPDLGQLAEQLWYGKRARITEYHNRQRFWTWEEKGSNELKWIITNYEYIRRDDKLKVLFPYCTPKTMLVLDESSAVKNHKSAQAEACMQLRQKCGRVLLLNGTPVANSPLDMFSQGNLMHPSILGIKYITHFKATYGVMEPVLGKSGKPLTTPHGRPVTTITKWKNLNDLQRRFAPYVLRREAKDLGINFALPPVALSVPLSESTWRIYKEMRDEMVAELQSGDLTVTQHAAIKSMRLAQITSGFIGGVRADNVNVQTEVQPGLLESLDLGLPFDEPNSYITREEAGDYAASIGDHVEYISREKLDFALEWQEELLHRYPDLKLLTWCRFVPELQRYLPEVATKFNHPVSAVAGQSILGRKLKEEREEALRLLHPKSAPTGPATVGGTYGTGSLGLNFTACRTVLDMSYDFSPWKKSQGDARVNRPGQTGPVSFFYLLATGPKGQKTIDHHIIMTRLGKQDINTWTASAWVKALMEE
jgi:hypothetical protein